MEEIERPDRIVRVTQGGTTVSWIEGEPNTIKITQTKPNLDARVMEHPTTTHTAPRDYKAACVRMAKAIDIVFQLGKHRP